jgi:anti-anti-sigma factor
MTGRLVDEGGVVTLALAGEFDIAAAATFAEMLAEAEGREPRAILVDLSELTFLDSTGAGMLWEAQTRLGAGGSFALLRGEGPAFRTLQLTGLGEHMVVLDRTEDAAQA